MVILNSSHAINELLEKRSQKYSSRPPRPMVSDIMSGGNRMVFMQYSQRWRHHRKIMHSILNGRMAEKHFVPHQNWESKRLAWDLLDNPENFFRIIQRFSSSVIVSMIFGRRVPKNDEFVRKSLALMDETARFVFSPWLNPADFFPILAKLPKFLQWWRPMGDRAYRRCLE